MGFNLGNLTSARVAANAPNMVSSNGFRVEPDLTLKPRGGQTVTAFVVGAPCVQVVTVNN